MVQLLTPQRVFIDTNHLIEMSKVVRDRPLTRPDSEAAYRTILERRRIGEIVPAIGFRQPMEWGSGGLEIAEVLDQGTAPYIVGDHVLVYVLETLREMYRVHGRSAEDLPEVMHRITERNEITHFFLTRTPPDDDPTLTAFNHVDHKWRSVRELVKQQGVVDAVRGAETEEVRLGQYRLGLWQTRENLNREKSAPREAIICRLKRIPQIAELLRQADIDPSEPRLWDEFCLDRCPALDLESRFWWRHAAASKSRRTHGNDADDVSFVPAYAYADFSMVENYMRGKIHEANPDYRSRVVSRPEDLIKILDTPIRSTVAG